MSQPATPQRAHRPAHSHSQSLSYSHARSPASPATPYTPISLRSFTSSNPSSTLATPVSAKSHANVLKHMSFSSPQLVKSYAANDNSLADLAQNWRSRANENGIKVSKSMVDTSQYDEDDSKRFFSHFRSYFNAYKALFMTATTRRPVSSLPKKVIPLYLSCGSVFTSPF